MGVCPKLFEERMTLRWRGLRNVGSDALVRSWNTTAQTLNRVADGHERNRWNILPLPTGTGKTQSVALYCAMLESDNPPGVVIVTPLKVQATEIADQINKLSGQCRAVAHHSDTPASSELMVRIPVLAVTHSAYQNRVGEADSSRSMQLTNWSRGPRRLTIIDETPPMVRAHRVTLQDIGQMHGALRGITTASQPYQLEALNDLFIGLDEARVTNDNRERFLSRRELKLLEDIDFIGMRASVGGTDAEEWQFGRSDGIEGVKIKQQCRATLRDLASIQRLGWAWLSQRGGVLSIHASEGVLPEEHFGGVILDATARVDTAYELLGERAKIVPTEAGIRRYGNVTLKVARNHRVGKQYLKKHISQVWPSVLRALLDDLDKQSNVLVCCHKAVEPYLTSYATGFSRLEVTHWGKVSGRNDWSDFDTVVILGLPYLDPTASGDTLMALRGPTNTDWLESAHFRSFGEHADIREALIQSHIVKCVIQAVNRVRCRRTIDANGNCLPTNIFMLLPRGPVAECITSAMENEMPGINSQPWTIDFSTHTARSFCARRALHDFLAGAPPGSYSKKDLVETRGFKKSTLDRFISSWKDPLTETAEAMKVFGVEYVSPKKGRGFEARFVKRAVDGPAVGRESDLSVGTSINAGAVLPNLRSSSIKGTVASSIRPVLDPLAEPFDALDLWRISQLPPA